jgi:Ser/Thr protein kinase RdoA (MazF antagonist)
MVAGWEPPLRARLENFLSSPTGISSQLLKYTNTRQTLVHGDFDLMNFLFDPETLQITAILDYDFSHVASPLDEYF